MTAVSLFTRDELATAFRLLMSPEAADRWATEWFNRFADETDVDEHGRYLYRDWDDESPSDDAILSRSQHADPLPGRTGYERFAEEGDDDVGEYLMSFSDFHLNLVALSSSTLNERVRVLRGDSEEKAARRRAQMLRIVDSMRPKPTLGQ